MALLVSPKHKDIPIVTLSASNVSVKPAKSQRVLCLELHNGCVLQTTMVRQEVELLIARFRGADDELAISTEDLEA